MSPAEIALIITAIGGAGGIGALVRSVRSSTPRRVRVESTAISTLIADKDKAIAERDAAKAGEREAWERADAMEARYDRMARLRNRWRERSHLQDLWIAQHCRPPGDEYPDRPEDGE